MAERAWKVCAANRATSIYIAGPMRGYPEHNFPAFIAATERFRANGFRVSSPVEIGANYFGNQPEVPGGEYLRMDLQHVVACESIALLPGWEASTGARCEVAVAITCGLAFYDALTGDGIPAPDRVTIAGGYERAPAVVVEHVTAGGVPLYVSGDAGPARLGAVL